MRALAIHLTLFLFGVRAWAMPTLTLPSAVVPSAGDTIIPFLTPFDADVLSLPLEFQNGWWYDILFRFSNWDTRYVDIILRDLGYDKQFFLGEIPYSSGVPVTFVTLDTPAGMDPAGGGANGYRVLEKEIPRRYFLQFDVLSGHHPLQVSNIWTTGTNHSHMLLVVHGDAIAAAGGTYQLPFMMTRMKFSNAASDWYNALVDVRGGTFTTVPEPGALAGLAVGAVGIVWCRFRRMKG